MNKHPHWRFIALTTAVAVLGLDQLTKHDALKALQTAGTTMTLPGPIDLTLVFNRSNAFGLIPDTGALSRWTLAALGIAIGATLLGSLLRSSISVVNAFGFAFIGAGALGNALDRLGTGTVIDFLDASKLGFVWVFNVADIAIDVGIALILLDTVLPLREIAAPATRP